MNAKRRKKIKEISITIINCKEILESIHGDLEEVYSDEEYAMDNVPESLQGSQMYEDMEEACEKLSESLDFISSTVDDLQGAYDELSELFE